MTYTAKLNLLIDCSGDQSLSSNGNSLSGTVQGPDFLKFLRLPITIRFDFTMKGACIINSVFCFKNAESYEKIKWK